MDREKESEMKMNAHDLIASGNWKEALVSNEEQELRLPMYLRLLASSQNLSSITAISSNNALINKDSSHDDNWNQSYIDCIVELLERIVVRYPCTDDVDLLVNHLASKVSKSVSKCRPLSKRTCVFSFKDGYLNDASISTDGLDQDLVLAKGVVATKKSIGSSGWDTSKLLLAAGIEPNHAPSEMNTLHKSKLDEDGDDEDNEEHLEIIQQMPEVGITEGGVSANKTSYLKRKRPEDDEIEQDTLMDTVQNTFLELVQLISSSLKPLLIHIHQDSTLATDTLCHCEEYQETENPLPTLSNGVALAVNSDSILAESALSSSLIVERDLSAIITSISSFIPAIRHEHLSSALCRSNIPQCAQIIQRLAANFPNTAHSLVRGCIHAYKIASMSSVGLEEHTKLAIMKTCNMSLRSIASLSNRERFSIVSELQVSKLMPSLMFHLLVEDGPDIVLSMIFADLVTSATRNTKKKHSSSQSPVYEYIRHFIRRKRNLCDMSHCENNSWIIDSIKTDSDFRDQIDTFLFQMLQTMKQNWIPGKACLIFQILGLYVDQLDSFVRSDFLIKSFSEVMGLLKQRYPEPRDALSMPHSDPDDKCLEAAFTTCFIICYRTISIHPKNTEHICEAVKNKLFVRSQQGDELISRLENMILSRSDDAIYRSILEVLIGRTCSVDPTERTQPLIRETVDVMKESLTRPIGDLIDTMDILRLLRATQCGFDSEFCTAVKTILHDANRCHYFYEQNGVDELLFQAVSSLNKLESPTIPAVLPLTLEMNCRYVANCTEELNDDDQLRWRQLVLQLIYALKFLEVHPKSPFALQPVILPVKWISEKAYVVRSGPCKVLLSLINTSCPFVRVQMSDRSLIPLPGPKIGRTVLNELTQTIHSIISDNHELSQKAERLFLTCRCIVPYHTVDTAVSKALLSSNEEFCDFMTYHNLVCDPLILLKCNLKVWKNNNLRRILLAVLQRLLLSNEVCVHDSGVSETVAAEYLISRDAVISHCFMALLSGNIDSKEGGYTSCQMMISMLKCIISKRKGLISSIVKQGLSDTIMNWIIRYLDVSDESSHLLKMMERKTLNVVERLRIADFALSVAVFGSQEISTSSRLAFLALSVLFQNFFLILGPVGVPANIVHDDEGHDITQICQVSMFKMLTTLTAINANHTHLKKETSHLLSRLVSLCKSEAATAGLSGVGLHKRKLLLKKVYQSIVKVNNCFGGGIQI